MRECNISLCHEKFGVYKPPRALCCALGDPLDGALLRRFGMTRCAVGCLTTGRRGRRPLQDSNIPHVRRGVLQRGVETPRYAS